MVSPDPALLDEALSAVMDGRATPADWARVNAAWAADPALRERWALWHAAADGLRSPDLPRLHREPEALLAALHARMHAEAAPLRRRRDWLAPFAVAAGFVALAVGLGMLRPGPAADAMVAVAPVPTPRAQGLSGQSFAETATGRNLTGDATPAVIDWGLPLTEPTASGPYP